jgi:hypothetical protein
VRTEFRFRAVRFFHAFALGLVMAGCASHAALLPRGTPLGMPASANTADRGLASVPTIPFFTTSFSYAGRNYVVKMVGTNPMLSAQATIIPVQIIPVALTFSDGTLLDGTPDLNILTVSPIFIDAAYQEGTTQYGDALMRSEFWNYTSTTGYHLLLAAPTILTTEQVNVPAADGYTKTKRKIKTGYVTYEWFVRTIQPQILQQRNIDPTTLTIFLTHNTRALEPTGYCCYEGYHSAFDVNTRNGPVIYTAVWANVERTTVATMGHELAEWMNDPFYTNRVPSWLDPSSLACGGNLLEVGDPTTRWQFKVNGYLLEDMAFYSWFTRTKPSIGINGQYDMLARLKVPSASCH